MALEIQKGRSKWWYGRVAVNGASIVRNLGVLIQGTPPRKLRKLGDIPFERSRAKAQAALEKLQIDLKSRRSAEELVQTIHEIRTGARVSTLPLVEVCARWKDLPRRRPLSDSYLAQAESRIERFLKFVKAANPAIHDMDQVQSPVCRAFCQAETKRGVTAKTYNNTLICLRSVFQSLRKEAGLSENPFDGIPTQEGETVFRHPFTAEELGILVEKAKANEFIYPLIVTGMCTAMRRGDCCTLLRESVDLKTGFIKVKTSKTGEYVQIPIFPLLRDVLEKAMEKPVERPPHYLFPDLEARYRVTPDYLTDRVRDVMRAAGFFDTADAVDEEEKNHARGEIHQERTTGLRRASVRDFHSFRVTWVTLALSAGVPLEIVQKVTGHRTASIVMKHYFQPGQEDFRRTLAGKMPALLVGPEPRIEPKVAPLDPAELRTKLTAMSSKTWKKIRDELLSRLPAPPAAVVDVTPTS
ncbi:MAG: tyrosine-type recombinase/integrase [Opitutaceae bacterium]|nr:tyrosine-type recombinase/integrase [Opitutaceae bacterium]